VNDDKDDNDDDVNDDDNDDDDDDDDDVNDDDKDDKDDNDDDVDDVNDDKDDNDDDVNDDDNDDDVDDVNDDDNDDNDDNDDDKDDVDDCNVDKPDDGLDYGDAIDAAKDFARNVTNDSGDDGNDFGDDTDDTDLLTGNSNRDRIGGDRTSSSIYANQVNDALLDGGDDLLVSNSANDLLTNPQGLERLILGNDSGIDIISNFLNGVEPVGLSNGFSFDRPSTIANGGNALMPADDRLLGNPGVSPNTFSAPDFIS
jgi:hypothetical protein